MDALTPDPRRAAQLLLVEVGNSHVSIAAAGRDKLTAAHRMDHGSPAELLAQVRRAWDAMPHGRRCALVIASVVPTVTEALRDGLAEHADIEAYVLGDDMPVPISTALADRRAIGIDRLCAAAAAYDEVQSACAIASFGTAITVDCVDDNGAFLGGAILPGLSLQAWSLHQRTAKLPEVALRPPETVYGIDTSDAIVNGVAYGAAGALREIVERYATDLGRWPKLIVTGGNAMMMRDLCDFIDVVVPDLVLRGMALSYREFFSDGDASEPSIVTDETSDLS